MAAINLVTCEYSVRVCVFSTSIAGNLYLNTPFSPMRSLMGGEVRGIASVLSSARGATETSIFLLVFFFFFLPAFVMNVAAVISPQSSSFSSFRSSL